LLFKKSFFNYKNKKMIFLFYTFTIIVVLKIELYYNFYIKMCDHNNNIQCMICMESFVETEVLKFCNDKHIFCKKCFNDYIKNLQKDEINCPYCRNIITFTAKEDEIPMINQQKTGFCIYYYKNGNIKEECNYVNDKRDGLYKSYYLNNNIKEECNYIDDKRNGLYKSYYLNNNIKEECNYVDDKKDGLYQNWYLNGQLWQKCLYENGRKKGLNEEYHENGQLAAECYYTVKEDEYLDRKRIFNLDGKLNDFFGGGCDTQYDNKEGLYKTYHFDGQLYEECFYMNNKKTGLYKSYYDNGQLEEETNYINGKPDGISKRYYENGQLESECTYVNGKKDGLCKIYYENGELECEKIFNEN
jgi:antitoxin component YwqK of YwqJK toxin-antitoxin module